MCVWEYICMRMCVCVCEVVSQLLPPLYMLWSSLILTLLLLCFCLPDLRLGNWGLHAEGQPPTK